MIITGKRSQLYTKTILVSMNVFYLIPLYFWSFFIFISSISGKMKATFAQEIQYLALLIYPVLVLICFFTAIFCLLKGKSLKSAFVALAIPSLDLIIILICDFITPVFSHALF